MNFHVRILVDGQWKEELFIFIPGDTLPLDFDYQIKMLVFSLLGISAFVVQLTDNSSGKWRF